MLAHMTQPLNETSIQANNDLVRSEFIPVSHLAFSRIYPAAVVLMVGFNV